MAKRLTLISLLMGSVLLLVACNPNVAQPTAKPAATTPPPTATAKPAPTATQAPAAALPTPNAQRPIVVGEPKAQQNVKSPVRISGLASVFEGTVQAEVVDSKGNVVGQGFTTASAGGPEVGTFSFDLAFTPPAQGEAGTVRVYSTNPRDGSRLGLVEVPVTLAR